MRIGYILLQFPVLSETFIMNELIELINRGHEVYVFSLIHPAEQVVHPEVKKYGLLERTHYLPGYARLGLELLRPQTWPTFFNDAYEGRPAKSKLLGKLFSAAAINYLPKVITDFHLDVLHTHFYGLPTFVTMQVSQRTGVPFTFTCHAYDIFINPNVEVMRKHMEAAAKVITISNYNSDYLQKVTGIGQGKIEVIRSCPILDKFQGIKKNGAHYTILTVARLVEKKGIKYGILAIAKLVKEFPQLSYKIIGAGPLENELLALVKSLRLEGNVEFLGKTSDEMLLAVLSRATMMLLPCIQAENGDQDGIPVTLMEAMYSQTPVISTNISGIPELIQDGKQGLLVEPKNVEQLIIAVRTLLSDTDLRARMGKAAKEKVEGEFNIHTEVGKLSHVWEQALLENGPSYP